jgi:phage-related protein
MTAVFVLHVFQKKSKSGVKTPRADLQLMQERLKAAEWFIEEMQQ